MKIENKGIKKRERISLTICHSEAMQVSLASLQICK